MNDTTGSNVQQIPFSQHIYTLTATLKEAELVVQRADGTWELDSSLSAVAGVGMNQSFPSVEAAVRAYDDGITARYRKSAA